MRRVPLDTVDFADVTGRSSAPLVYAEAFIQIAKTPQGGITGEEMDIPLAIESAIRTAQSQKARFVLLEDAQWQWLLNHIKVNRWPFASQTFKDLIAAVVDAEVVDPNLRAVSSAAE